MNSEYVTDSVDDGQIWEFLRHKQDIHELVIFQGCRVNDSGSHEKLLVNSVWECGIKYNTIKIQFLLSDSSLLSETVQLCVCDCFAHIN